MGYSIAAGPTVETHTTATSLVISGVTAPVGSLVIVGLSADNGHASGTSSYDSIVDSASNSWTVDATVNRTAAGAANDGVTLLLAHSVITNALAGGTITIGYLESIVAKCAVTWIVSPDGRKLESYTVPATASNGSQTPSSGAVSVSLTDTIIGFIADQRAGAPPVDSDTTNGSWSTHTYSIASTGVQSTSVAIGSQYKTPSAAGDQTFDSDLGVVAQWALATILLSYRVECALSVTSGTDQASFVATAVWDVVLDATEGADLAAFTDHEVDLAALASREAADRAALLLTTDKVIASIRVLCEITWPVEGSPKSRLWDGGGPLVDLDGFVWKGVRVLDGLDVIEHAMNGEAFTLNISLTGVEPDDADSVWGAYQADELIGAVMRIMIQPCDDYDQPIGDAEVRFTGRVDNVIFSEATEDKGGPVSTITLEVTNRFTLRRLTSGAVLSDPDQRARAAVLNPTGAPDRFAERVPLMQDKTIVWPRWN